MSFRHTGAVATTITVALAMSLLVVTQANADPWAAGPPDGGAHPDGASHSYCWGVEVDGGVNADIFDNVDSAEIVSLQTMTDATVLYKDDCVYTGDSETDVVWLTRNLPGTRRGETFCDSFHLNGNCDQFYSALDLAQIAQGSSNELDETKTACHELGHTVGLTHHDETKWKCMMSGEPPNAKPRWKYYSDHHVGHIDDWF